MNLEEHLAVFTGVLQVDCSAYDRIFFHRTTYLEEIFKLLNLLCYLCAHLEQSGKICILAGKLNKTFEEAYFEPLIHEMSTEIFINDLC